MKKSPVIFGVDFSGAQDAGKKIWIARVMDLQNSEGILRPVYLPFWI
jgi:hypothetical protein